MALSRRANNGANNERTDADVLHEQAPVDNTSLLCAAHGRCLVDVAADRVEAWPAEPVTAAEWAALMVLYVWRAVAPAREHACTVWQQALMHVGSGRASLPAGGWRRQLWRRSRGDAHAFRGHPHPLERAGRVRNLPRREVWPRRTRVRTAPRRARADAEGEQRARENNENRGRRAATWERGRLFVHVLAEGEEVPADEAAALVSGAADGTKRRSRRQRQSRTIELQAMRVQSVHFLKLQVSALTAGLSGVGLVG